MVHAARCKASNERSQVGGAEQRFLAEFDRLNVAASNRFESDVRPILSRSMVSRPSRWPSQAERVWVDRCGWRGRGALLSGWREFASGHAPFDMDARYPAIQTVERRKYDRLFRLFSEQLATAAKLSAGSGGSKLAEIRGVGLEAQLLDQLQPRFP